MMIRTLIIAFSIILFLPLSAFSLTAALSDGSTFYKLIDKKAAKNVVFIHGGNFSSWTYTLSSRSLARKGFNVLYYDLYGMGKSSAIQTKTYSRKILLRQLRELLAHVGWDKSKTPLYILGNGTGASLATVFANNNPKLVTKLALVAPSYNSRDIGGPIAEFFHDMMQDDPESPWLRLLLKVIVEKKLEEYFKRIPEKKKGLLKRYIDKETASFSYYDGLFRRLLGDLYDSYSSSYKRLSRNKIPAIVLNGADDEDLPAHQLKSLTHGNKNIQVKTYKGLGGEFTLLKSKDISQSIADFFNAP